MSEWKVRDSFRQENPFGFVIYNHWVVERDGQWAYVVLEDRDNKTSWRAPSYDGKRGERLGRRLDEVADWTDRPTAMRRFQDQTAELRRLKERANSKNKS